MESHARQAKELFDRYLDFRGWKGLVHVRFNPAVDGMPEEIVVATTNHFYTRQQALQQDLEQCGITFTKEMGDHLQIIRIPTDQDKMTDKLAHFASALDTAPHMSV